jgi:hypothetical protein
VQPPSLVNANVSSRPRLGLGEVWCTVTAILARLRGEVAALRSAAAEQIRARPAAGDGRGQPPAAGANVGCGPAGGALTCIARLQGAAKCDFAGRTLDRAHCGAGPTIQLQRKADLDIEMLAGDQRELGGSFLLGLHDLASKEILIDRSPHIGVHERPEPPILPTIVLRDGRRQLVQDRQQRQPDLAVAHIARHGELGPEHARRRLLLLGRDLEQEAVGPRRQRPSELYEHFGGSRLLAKTCVSSIRVPTALLPVITSVSGRLDLQCGAGPAVRDQPDMPLDVEQLRELAVEPDGAGRLLEGNIRDLLRGRDQEELTLWAAIHDQRHHHHGATVRALRILLCDQEEEYSWIIPLCVPKT